MYRGACVGPSVIDAIPVMNTSIPGLVLILSTACSSASTAANAFPLSVTSDSGALHIEMTASPDPPVVGTDTLELTITSAADGSPEDGLSVALVPYMTSMGHGTSATTVTPEGGGKYLVSEVYLFMPGVWELKTTITGAVADHAEPTFQLQ